MKNNISNNGQILTACLAGCQKMVQQLAHVKDAVMSQFRDRVAEHAEMLHLALNEAEAVAWQSEFPHLVFPDLAEEKARSVVGWVAHQRLVRSRALAA